MKLIAANLSAMRNIMTLNARASRSEYWWVFGVYVIGIIGGAIIRSYLFPYGGGDTVLYSWLKFAYILFLLVWGLALCSLSVRRLHDADRTGLWVWSYLFAFPLAVFLVPILCLKRGTDGPNRFGPEPR